MRRTVHTRYHRTNSRLYRYWTLDTRHRARNGFFWILCPHRKLPCFSLPVGHLVHCSKGRNAAPKHQAFPRNPLMRVCNQLISYLSSCWLLHTLVDSKQPPVPCVGQPARFLSAYVCYRLYLSCLMRPEGRAMAAAPLLLDRRY